MRTNEAPSDLLPEAKLMDSNLSKKQKKKLKKQARNNSEASSLQSDHPNPFNIPPPVGIPPQMPVGLPAPAFQPSMQVNLIEMVNSNSNLKLCLVEF